MLKESLCAMAGLEPGADRPGPGERPGASVDGPPLTLPLDAVADGQEWLVGGKAANLALLRRACFPVPSGFCVTTAAFAEFLQACPRREELSGLLERLARADPADLPHLSRQAQACLADVPVPDRVERAVRAAGQAHSEGQAYAVRSSATAEDTRDHSFAGQFETCLNVRGGDALLTALRHCWLSVFSPRALAYQAKRGLAGEPLAMAVVVQFMVPADCAGVLFTVDPVSRSARCMVLEAVAGLGDRLVSGAVTPERAVVDRRTLRVVEHHPVPETAGLDAALLRRLGELGLQTERLFGQPQDMEWAVSQGEVYVLQARPIPARPRSRPPEVQVWTNANIIETLPGVLTPMAWSFALLLRDCLHQLMSRLGLEVGDPPLIDRIAGRAYLNVRGLFDLVGRIGPIPDDFPAVFGGPAKELLAALPRGHFSLREVLRLRNLRRSVRFAVWLLPGLVGQQALLERWRRRVFGELALTPPGRLSDVQLARHTQAILQRATGGVSHRTWAAAAWMAITAIGGSMTVYRLTRRWLDDADGQWANRLLSGAGNLNSAENGRALYRLAAWARERPALAQALRTAGSFAGFERRLATVESGPEFLERWRAFMLNHGHQARGGMDLGQPRWSERPDHVLDLLRGYLDVPVAEDPPRLEARRLEERAAAVADCRRRLRNPLKRGLLLFLVRCSQRGLMQRENVKNEGVRLLALLRRTVLEAGRRLAERGVLGEADDVLFLRLEELEPALCGRPGWDIRATVAARQAEHAHHLQLNPPPVVVGRYDPEGAPSATAEPLPAGTRVLHGVGASPGLVSGPARVILHLDTKARVLPGEILVAPHTDPGWTPYFLPAAGIVVDIGGLLSHGSVVAREYGLPAVVNVGQATRLIRTGDRLLVDGTRGRVTLLSTPDGAPGADAGTEGPDAVPAGAPGPVTYDVF